MDQESIRRSISVRTKESAAIIARVFSQFDLFPEFLRRLRRHFAEAVMGATVSGLIIFIVAILTSLPHWVWLIVLVGAFVFSSYSAWREEYLRNRGKAELSSEAQALVEHTAALGAYTEGMKTRQIDRMIERFHMRSKKKQNIKDSES